MQVYVHNFVHIIHTCANINLRWYYITESLYANIVGHIFRKVAQVRFEHKSFLTTTGQTLI